MPEANKLLGEKVSSISEFDIVVHGPIGRDAAHRGKSKGEEVVHLVAKKQRKRKGLGSHNPLKGTFPTKSYLAKVPPPLHRQTLTFKIQTMPVTRQTRRNKCLLPRGSVKH